MYKSKNHSKYSLKAHLVFATKYCKKPFDNQNVVFELKRKLQEIANRSNFEIELMGVDRDHIHILVDYKPNISIVQIVKRLKQESQHHMWIVFEKEPSKTYWKESHMFLSKGYFVCSIREGASYETIQEYIKSQG